VNIALVRELLAFDDRRTKLETELATLKKDRKAKELEVLDDFDEGVNSIKVDDRTVYLRRDLWASGAGKDPDEFKAYIRSLGLNEYIKESVNSQSLSAWYREREEFDDLPAGFTDNVKCSENFSIRTTK
jgi:hypothetical protein